MENYFQYLIRCSLTIIIIIAIVEMIQIQKFQVSFAV